MTTNQRQEHSALHTRATKRLESPFVTIIKGVIKAQINAVAAKLKASGVYDAQSLLNTTIVDNDLMKPIEYLYRVFGIYAARKTIAQINKSARIGEVKAGFGINDEIIARIIQFLTENIFIKAVVPISRTNRDLILARIIEGQQKGWGAARIADDLQGWDMPSWRSLMLVRTESQFAMGYGRQEGKRASRWQTESVWIAANDHRTRHSHRVVDGDRVDEGKRFAVPIMKGNAQVGIDLMLGPGDPSASAGNVINCRCTMATVAKRDEKGNLIPKRNISVILPGGFVNTGLIKTV